MDFLNLVWAEFLEKESDKEYRSKLRKNLGVSAKRVDGLYKLARSEKKLNYFNKLDIQAYLAKSLRGCKYVNPLKMHDYSCGSNFSYDPAKNGQNILKHGLGFGEVVSYSQDFGSLIVPVPNKSDGERMVVFSNLKSLDSVDSLCFPLAVSPESNILNIVAHRDGGFRFISSRQLSSNRVDYIAAIKRALKESSNASLEGYDDFVTHCINYAEENIFKNKSI